MKMLRPALLLIAALLLLTAGCASTRKLPSEDIEVPQLYPELIAVLKNPSLPANSKEKYEAIRELIEKVDMTFTRETKTIDQLLYYGDAIIDDPRSENRIITFNYQYGDHYIRLKFYTYRNFVHRVDVITK